MTGTTPKCYNPDQRGSDELARNYEVSRETQLRANEKYDKANTRQIKLKLNVKTDSDIIKKLDEVDNKQGYIKNLIREDIKTP